MFSADSRQSLEFKHLRERHRICRRAKQEPTPFHTASAKSAERSQALESMFDTGLPLNSSHSSLPCLANAAADVAADQAELRQLVTRQDSLPLPCCLLLLHHS